MLRVLCSLILGILLAAGLWGGGVAGQPCFEAGVAFAAEREAVSLSETSIVLSVGEKRALSVVGIGEQAVSWRVKRSRVASVSENGVVEGVASGTTEVIAEAGGREYRCTVRVERLSLSRTKVTAQTGNTLQLRVSGTKRKVLWRSSDTSVVKVSAAGKLTFLLPGTADVTASVGSMVLTCRVTVAKPSVSVPASMAAGETGTVGLGGKTYKKITFSSDAPEIVSADGDGQLTARRPGTARITVRIADYSVTKEVAVRNTVEGAVLSGCIEGLSGTDARLAKKAHEVYAAVVSEEMTQVEKIRAIHDYIVENTEYACEEYRNGTLSSVPYVFSAEGVLLRQRAVCQGYAEALELFLNAMGAENRLVYGYGITGGERIGHAWNLVKLDGSWYHIDATWDDPIVDGRDSGRIYYDYFLINDAAIKKDHIWQEKDYPAAKGGEYTDYVIRRTVEEYRAEGRYLEALDDYAEEIAARCAGGEWESELMFYGREQPDTDAMLRKVAGLVPGRGLRAYLQYFYYGDYTIWTTRIVVE